MAKINNTTVYPKVTPAQDDLLILTDKNDSDKTKTSSVADFQDFFGTSTVVVTVTADQIRFLNTVPVDIVDAGPGKFVQVIAASLQYLYATAPFTFTGSVNLAHAAAAATIENTFDGSIISGINNVTQGPKPGPFLYPSPLGGDKLILWANAANPTGALAEGVLKVSVQYRIYSF